MSDEHDAVDAVGPSRRSFVKGLIATGVFAAPVVSSFTMSGVQAVFGATPRSTAMGLNCNTSFPRHEPPPGFTGPSVAEFIHFSANAGVNHTYSTLDGAVGLRLDVPANALPACTIFSIYPVDPSAITALVPAGETLLNGYAVVWSSQGGPFDPDALSPLTFTVTNVPVVVGNVVYELDKTTGAATPSATVPVNGQWVVSFTVDPGFIVTQAAAAAPVVSDPTFTG